MTDTVTVAGVECELGCWVDGHWGQYGPDHLADKVEIDRLNESHDIRFELFEIRPDWPRAGHWSAHS